MLIEKLGNLNFPGGVGAAMMEIKASSDFKLSLAKMSTRADPGLRVHMCEPGHLNLLHVPVKLPLPLVPVRSRDRADFIRIRYEVIFLKIGNKECSEFTCNKTER